MGESLFVPYVYVPSAEASYVKLVTPWGNVQLNKGFLEQLAVSVGVVVLTVLLWRCSTRLNATLKKKTSDKKKKKTEGEEGEEEEGDDDDDGDDEPRSALDESMVKKGENSYYYAREVKEEDNSVHKTTVSSYGWSDNKETVTIYLTDSVVKNMKDEQLVLKWTKTSLSMDLLNAPDGDQAKSLVISTLFQEITDVTWTARKDTLTLTLTKAQVLPWKSLNGAAKNMEEHIDYDESLYD